MEAPAREYITRNGPVIPTGAAFLCADIVQIDNKPEPVPDGKQVRIMLLCHVLTKKMQASSCCDATAIKIFAESEKVNTLSKPKSSQLFFFPNSLNARFLI